MTRERLPTSEKKNSRLCFLVALRLAQLPTSPASECARLTILDHFLSESACFFVCPTVERWRRFLITHTHTHTLRLPSPLHTRLRVFFCVCLCVRAL